MRGKGPQAVVTDLAIMVPDENGELQVTALHPGVELEEVRNNTGWEIKVAAILTRTAEPTPEELRILHEELDPTGIYLN